jgi:hydrogenase expression/formation protein HypC
MCLALPGEIVERREGALPMALVRFGTVRREVCLAYVPDAAIGDWVIVHVGFAIQRLDEAEARRTLALLASTADAIVDTDSAAPADASRRPEPR